MKKMAKPSIFRVSAFFVVLPFLCLPGPGIIGSEDLGHGESDPFNIADISAISLTAGKDGPSLACLADLHPVMLSSQGHQSWNTCPEVFIPTPTLSVALRC
jgi:hypothetical protein